jgi:hypothetical protein
MYNTNECLILSNYGMKGNNNFHTSPNVILERIRKITQKRMSKLYNTYTLKNPKLKNHGAFILFSFIIYFLNNWCTIIRNLGIVTNCRTKKILHRFIFIGYRHKYIYHLNSDNFVVVNTNVCIHTRMVGNLWLLIFWNI